MTLHAVKVFLPIFIIPKTFQTNSICTSPNKRKVIMRSHATSLNDIKFDAFNEAISSFVQVFSEVINFVSGDQDAM